MSIIWFEVRQIQDEKNFFFFDVCQVSADKINGSFSVQREIHSIGIHPL